MEKLSQDELWAIYETLPASLKEAIFSEDTADAIMNICRLYDIKETPKVAKIVGNVLMGLLPPDMLKTALVAEAGVSQETAKKASMEIEHFILNPVKKDLDNLYEEQGGKQKKNEGENKDMSQVKNSKAIKKDVYREPIE